MAENIKTTDFMSLKLNFQKQNIAHAIEKKVAPKPRSKTEKNVWYMLDSKKVLRVTYPHGNGMLPKGTTKSIINQLRLSNDQFKDLVDCPMSASDYEKFIRSLNLL